MAGRCRRPSLAGSIPAVPEVRGAASDPLSRAHRLQRPRATMADGTPTGPPGGCALRGGYNGIPARCAAYWNLKSAVLDRKDTSFGPFWTEKERRRA
jgi:hypothetical protein